MIRKLALVAALLHTAAYAQDLPSCGTDRGQFLGQTSVSKPDQGADGYAEIGQSMLESDDAEIYGGSPELTSPVQFSGRNMGKDYAVAFPAAKLTAINTNRGIGYTSDSATFQYSNDKGPRHGLSRPDVAVLPDPANLTGLIGYVNFGLSTKTVPIAGASLTFRRCLLLSSIGLRRELEYGGVSKGTVTLQYREFSGNLARPAFSQELHYDLADGAVIGFKGSRIQIIKATNTAITYRILAPIQ